VAGSANCTLCPNGTVSDAYGAGSNRTCVACPANSYSTDMGANSSSCLACPNLTDTSSPSLIVDHTPSVSIGGGGVDGLPEACASELGTSAAAPRRNGGSVLIAAALAAAAAAVVGGASGRRGGGARNI
jgi:hypothetical protein